MEERDHMTYAVAGVTGNTGRVVAETLLSQGKSVRVVVRDPKKGEAWRARGAEVAVADLGDTASLTKALEGAEGAYLLIPPNMAAPSFRAYQDATAGALVRAVRASLVPHVVLLSSVGAQHASGTGPIAALHHLENELSALEATRCSFLRAGYFIENLAGSLGMLAEGALPSFFPADFGIDFVATKDIGKLAAQLLVEGTEATQIVELAGPKQSMNDAARALAAITGKPVAVKVLPLDAMVPTLTSMGLSGEVAEMYREMTDGILRGHVAFEGGRRRVVGTTTLEEVLRPIVTGAGA
jgi:uncharacterized protein YbjT (DUF2867 family)